MLYALGTIIRFKREELKLPLWTLAAYAQIAPETLLKIERAQSDLDLLTFRLLADGLKTSPTELLELADKMRHASPVSEKRMENRVKTLRTMDKLANQHGRLLRQLDILEQHYERQGKNSENDRQKIIDMKESLNITALKASKTRDQQDQREKFLFRFLLNRDKFRPVTPLRTVGTTN